MSTTTGHAGLPLQPPAELGALLLDPDRLDERQRRADRLLMAEGAGHLVHDLPVRADGRSATVESRPWRLDPVPVVLDARTFRWLSLAVAERLEALESVVSDLYREQSLVRSGVVPAKMLAATDRFRVAAMGTSPPRWITSYAVDVALGDDGAWYVVQDLTDVPAGLGYALLDRSVTSRVLPDAIARADVASLARYAVSVRRALAATSPVASPRTVLFSGGLDHASYVDHSYLAVQLGINLVEGADLVVRQRRLWLRTLDGLEPVDVLMRRIEDSMVDPLDVASEGSLGVPGLLQTVRAGGAVLANAHGSGVVEDPEVRGVLADAIARIHPTEQSLTALPPGVSVAVTQSIASAAPGRHTSATVIRMFAVHDGERVAVLPGGTGRVLAPGDDPRLPTACLAKDVWVLGQTVAPVVGARLPQVNFGRSVPTRAADALYWTNRSAERAEATTRAMRVIGSRIEQDTGLLTLDGGTWTDRMIRVASGLGHVPRWVPMADPGALDAELSALGDAVARQIGALLTEAMRVREFLSVTTGRVLSHLAELRASLQAHQTDMDDLDDVLADFAALAGLWRESTVRGPAWRIGDTGRRLERCLVVLDLVEAMFEPRPDAVVESDEVTTMGIEVLLAATESLVAYRRRYRSDVEIDAALELVVRDEANPRSLAASIEVLHGHALDGEQAVGGDFVERARRALELPTSEMVPVMRELVAGAGSRIVGQWFSTPVDPIAMHPTAAGR